MKPLIDGLRAKQLVLDTGKQDTLINQSEEARLYVLAVILLVLILLAVGFLNRKVENMLLLAIFLSAILISLIMVLFR